MSERTLIPPHAARAVEGEPRLSMPDKADAGSLKAMGMGKPMHDKQSEPDHRQLPINKVGVRGLRFPIQIRDKAHAVQNTIATVGMFVDLPKEFKGTHMSRFIEGTERARQHGSRG